ncbi:MAG TPA: rhomboid family intramembrane serine protease [Candidatus Desulfovibrio intestinavium]|uniref:Rhomboid family intramembrane serine protease n=1 Tax=Candidatus Desulfovibrio intestinavium TaxID=2838534 RepID=A0A9D2HLN9_9BACT|nr:rhomboid family intramembrane serine protease [Candidatus Desulfovibrio intestinavium]
MARLPSSPPSPRLCRIRRFRLRRRPSILPPYWCRLTPPSGFDTLLHKREWELVFSARGIPYRFDKFAGREHLYVPPLLADVALHELQAVAREQRRPPEAPPPPPQPHAGWAALLPLFLVIWHGWREGWWPCPILRPSPADWCDLGGLSSVRIAEHGEWYRVVTALTLHNDTPHLWGNVLFTLIFLPILARTIGVGRALWLCLLGGSLGNLLDYLFRTHAFASVGFSTAFFAVIGINYGMYTIQKGKKSLITLGAGLGILAMLGTGNEDVDYLAHCCGFGVGFLLGLMEGRQRRNPSKYALPQWLFAGLAALLLLLAWWMAFGGVLVLAA